MSKNGKRDSPRRGHLFFLAIARSWPFGSSRVKAILDAWDRLYLKNYTARNGNQLVAESVNGVIRLFSTGRYKDQGFAAPEWRLSNDRIVSSDTVVVELHINSETFATFPERQKVSAFAEGLVDCLLQIENDGWDLKRVLIRSVALLGETSKVYGFSARLVPPGWTVFWEELFRILLGYIYENRDLCDRPLMEIAQYGDHLLKVTRRRFCKTVASTQLVPEAAQ